MEVAHERSQSSVRHFDAHSRPARSEGSCLLRSSDIRPFSDTCTYIAHCRDDDDLNQKSQCIPTEVVGAASQRPA